MASTDLSGLDATALAQLIRRGELDPISVLETTIEVIERLNPSINAIVTPLFDKARRHLREGIPDGPFRGVPIVVKDFMCPTEGDPYYEGIGGLRKRAVRSPRDCYVAQRLRAAGFLIVGRTNTPELAQMGTTEPLAFGATRNPYDLDRSAGGSSGGSAAAVASGMVTVAHGTDGAGSIRVPAAACGLVGLKPSRGRISFGPDMGADLGMRAVHGTLARSVRDTAALLDTMSGVMPGDPFTAPNHSTTFQDGSRDRDARLRVGLLTRSPRGPEIDPDHARATELTAHALEQLGHAVSFVDPTALHDPRADEDLGILRLVNTANALDTWSERTADPLTRDDVEPQTWGMAEQGRLIGAVQLARALTTLQDYGRRVARWCHQTTDVLLTPAVPGPPPLIGATRDRYGPQAESRIQLRANEFAGPFNISGQPALTLPTPWRQHGLPICVQLAAGYGREDLLLQLASQLEKVQPWTPLEM